MAENKQHSKCIFYSTVLILIVFSFGNSVYGQMQLVLLKHERVILRLNPGDEFVYRLKNSRSIKTSYVNNLSDTAIVTHSDVVPFHTIERIYFPHLTFYNKVGGALVVGGTLLFLIDQLNVAVVQDGEFNLDDGVAITSLSMVGVGLPMMLIKKRSQRLNHKYHLLMVKKGSPFYAEDPHTFLDN